jgi:hypothetical protein
MGRGYWDDKDWTRYSKVHIAGKKSVDDIFTSKSIDPSLDPKEIKIRESCDSIDNPNSTALIVGLDVTGSMGCVLDSIAREGLKNMATEVYNRKPISNPHIMFLGIGDAEARDLYPLQATQFEADIRIAEQLTKIYLERGGGGNKYESYALAWYFASLHTKIDCFEKRKKKGFLFTIGDEEPTPYLKATDIERVMGYRPQSDYLVQDLLTMVSRQYEVYHLMIREGSYFRSHGDIVKKKWRDLLGQRAIVLDDYTRIGEVIVSTLQVANGENPDTVIKIWDSSTSLVVANAIRDLTSNVENNAAVVRF